MKQCPYSGVAVDLEYTIRAHQKGKMLVHDILESFPLAQLSLDRKAGGIRTIFFG
jgi:hypothetical protein